MTGFSLRPGLSYAAVGSQLIFLDIVADRYFTLSEAATGAFREFVIGNPLMRQPTVASRSILDLALIVPSEKGEIAPFEIHVTGDATAFPRRKAGWNGTVS